jgi:hypothetical protein
LARITPLTDRRYCGAVVPMPTLPLFVTTKSGAVLPWPLNPIPEYAPVLPYASSM